MFIRYKKNRKPYHSTNFFQCPKKTLSHARSAIITSGAVVVVVVVVVVVAEDDGEAEAEAAAAEENDATIPKRNWWHVKANATSGAARGSPAGRQIARPRPLLSSLLFLLPLRRRRRFHHQNQHKEKHQS